MSYTLSKDEIRKPDQLTQWGRMVLDVVIQNSKVVAGLLGLMGLVSIGILIKNKISEGHEIDVQGQYYAIEKTYLKKKEAFAKGESDAKAGDKKAKEAKDAKVEQTEDGVTPQLASGDILKDYGTELEGFKKLVQAEPKTKAAAMAVLEMSDLYLKYKNPQEATQVLAQAKEQQKPDHLLGALVYHSYAQLLADQNRCADAIPVWDALLGKGGLKFMVEPAQYGQAVCYATMGQFEKAELLLKGLVAEKKTSGAPGEAPAPNSAIQGAAKKYLRFINFKKKAEASKTI